VQSEHAAQRNRARERDVFVVGRSQILTAQVATTNLCVPFLATRTGTTRQASFTKQLGASGNLYSFNVLHWISSCLLEVISCIFKSFVLSSVHRTSEIPARFRSNDEGFQTPPPSPLGHLLLHGGGISKNIPPKKIGFVIS
jgi:hypothetical protein